MSKEIAFSVNKKLAEGACVTEALKAESAMLWVQQINDIRCAAVGIRFQCAG